MSLERRVGGDGITANREECQQGLWKDMLQRERLMVMEGLEWGRDRGSATLCVKQEHIKNSVKFYLEQKLNIRQNFF